MPLLPSSICFSVSAIASCACEISLRSTAISAFISLMRSFASSLPAFSFSSSARSVILRLLLSSSSASSFAISLSRFSHSALLRSNLSSASEIVFSSADNSYILTVISRSSSLESSSFAFLAFAACFSSTGSLVSSSDAISRIRSRLSSVRFSLFSASFFCAKNFDTPAASSKTSRRLLPPDSTISDTLP